MLHTATDVSNDIFPKTHVTVSQYNYKLQCLLGLPLRFQGVIHTHTHAHSRSCVYCFNICAGPTQSPGTLIKWWECLCSAPPFWSGRGWACFSLACCTRDHSCTHRYRQAAVFCWRLLTLLFLPLRLCPLQGLLQGCNSMSAGYLFQPDKQYDVTYDTGDKAIQCGRHVDIFKFWLMWKAKVCILSAIFFWSLYQPCCHI